MKRLTRTGLFLLTGGSAMLMAGLATAALEDEIRERIRPVGEVCLIGDPCAAGVTVAGGDTSGGAPSGGAPKDPQQIYQTYCFACHGTGANNSPVLGDAEAWEPRIAKGMDALYESSINGFNNGLMPPRGLCLNCTDDDLRDTVDYMVDQVP